MPRIRTIKPEFWTDEKMVRLPFEARLLFIGLWNYADDDGYILDEPERIRMQIFPSDRVDTDGLLDLLFSAEILDKLELADGGTAFRIRHFKDHQSISHPSASRIAPKISGKRPIRSEERRRLATKYGCKPGGAAKAQCYSCCTEGSIYWTGSWVGFSGLEIAHFEPEAEGGASSCDNLVLCCRFCNRSMHTKDPVSYISKSIPEDSRGLRPEGKRREAKGSEGKGIEFNSDGKAIGSAGDTREDLGQPPPRPPQPTLSQSPKRFVRNGEAFDLGDLDWSAVVSLAESVARKVRPFKDADRRMWLKAAVLASVRFSEHWLMDSVDAVLNAKETKRTKQAHLVGVWKRKAIDDEKVAEDEYESWLGRIEIPDEIWKSNVVEVRRGA